MHPPPPSLSQLEQLRVLSLAKNQLDQLPEELGSCRSLEELDVSANRLAALPAALGGLGKLRTLQLDSNRLSGLPDGLLTGCSMLQTLSLHANPVTIEALQATPGFADYERRRQAKYSKAISSGVLLNSGGLDEGVDRPLVPAAAAGS
jgi:hypothetical protein